MVAQTRLGLPCKRGHDHEGTGLTLRLVSTGRCVECRREDRVTHKERDPERLREAKKAEYERNRERYLGSFRRWREGNAAEKREYDARYYRENQERLRPRRAMREAVRRARKRGVAALATLDQVLARIAFYGGLCWICGAPYEEVDHVKPLAAGGAHIACNLRPICSTCNRTKNAKWEGVKMLPKPYAVRIGEPLREGIKGPAPHKVEPGPREEPVPAPRREEREAEPAAPARRKREKVPA